MEKAITNYWNKRRTDLENALESNKLEVFLAGEKNTGYQCSG